MPLKKKKSFILRYGALAGFGLSLAKWTLIVKHSTDFASGSDNTWLWWLFTAFGMIVCMRAIFQVHINNFSFGYRTHLGSWVHYPKVIPFKFKITFFFFQYLHIKRSWSSLSTSARERLFFYWRRKKKSKKYYNFTLWKCRIYVYTTIVWIIICWRTMTSCIWPKIIMNKYTYVVLWYTTIY